MLEGLPDSLSGFESFYDQRRAALMHRIIKLLGVAAPAAEAPKTLYPSANLGYTPKSD
jgi:hypothetical protein